MINNTFSKKKKKQNNDVKKSRKPRCFEQISEIIQPHIEIYVIYVVVKYRNSKLKTKYFMKLV